ncbi:hypothetical protein E2R53_13150 [Peribacillus frigoritolerans]|nr:hypothetical protein E2R53_13150 [Peribacillus frigoritolerans]
MKKFETSDKNWPLQGCSGFFYLGGIRREQGLKEDESRTVGSAFRGVQLRLPWPEQNPPINSETP